MKKHRQKKRVNNEYQMKAIHRQTAHNIRVANEQRDLKTSLAEKEDQNGS